MGNKPLTYRRTTRHCGQTCDSHPTSILTCTTHKFINNASQSHNRNDYAIACQARNDENKERGSNPPSDTSLTKEVKNKTLFPRQEVEDSGTILSPWERVRERVLPSPAVVTRSAHTTTPSGGYKAAFTLAEVLITLAIIGIVAALTIPVLMSKYREQVTMNKLKKFYSTMAQAQLRSVTDNGEIETWDWVPYGGESNNKIVLNWFNKYFGQYLQKIEIIDNKVLNNDNELVDSGVFVMLSDGSVINFGGFAGGYMHIYYYTDYKTFKNKTAQIGKDMFLFGFMIKANGHKCLKTFNAYGCDWDENTLKYSPWGGCYTENPTQGKVYCTRLLQINNWQVPKNYPFKF